MKYAASVVVSLAVWFLGLAMMDAVWSFSTVQLFIGAVLSGVAAGFFYGAITEKP